MITQDTLDEAIKSNRNIYMGKENIPITIVKIVKIFDASEEEEGGFVKMARIQFIESGEIKEKIININELRIK